jgi:uncharacterized protein YndB with AHSA1/START domain
VADIAMQIDINAPADDVYTALTTTGGVAGWWTTKNETSGTVGDVNTYWFPGAPFSYDMRVEEARPGERVTWRCVAGPPEWIGTGVRWSLTPSDGATLLLLDHDGFAEVGTMYRMVTMGWAQMLTHLKKYLESGQPTPFFTI